MEIGSLGPVGLEFLFIPDSAVGFPLKGVAHPNFLIVHLLSSVIPSRVVSPSPQAVTLTLALSLAGRGDFRISTAESGLNLISNDELRPPGLRENLFSRRTTLQNRLPW